MKTNQIGQRIRLFRKRAGVTQLELELRINASFGSISRMENGLTNPTKETLFSIAEALYLNSYETAHLFGIELNKGNLAKGNIIDQQFDNIYQV